MTLAIIGAAGAIGQSVAAAIHARDGKIRLIGRTEQPLRSMAKPGDEIVIADVADLDGCRRALEGCDTALYTLGLPYTAKAFEAYPPMMETFVRSASASGIRRAILITNVYPYGRPLSARVAEIHPRQPCSRKGELRKRQEDIFLQATDFEAISLRLPDFYGPHVPSSLLGQVADAARSGRGGNLLAPADRPHEFVFTPDVGPVVADLLEFQGGLRGPFNFAGAGVVSMLELAQMIYRAAGHKPKLRIMPVWMQTIAGLAIPVLRELAEMRYLLETPVLLDDSKLQALLPGLHKTSYEEAAQQIAKGSEP